MIVRDFFLYARREARRYLILHMCKNFKSACSQISSSNVLLCNDAEGLMLAYIVHRSVFTRFIYARRNIHSVHTEAWIGQLCSISIVCLLYQSYHIIADEPLVNSQVTLVQLNLIFWQYCKTCKITYFNH